ncbi:MAG TPA: hypothetical protein VFU90_07665, partial [Candidatus Tumulicola sp.]|nr:hypothetical protein [Candidatus Tumulicola sp.]
MTNMSSFLDAPVGRRVDPHELPESSMRIFAAVSRPASQLCRLLTLAALALASAAAWAAPGALVSKTLTQIPGNDTKSYAIALQSDGKILTAGYAYLGTKQFAITRYNADGTVDTGFADAGTRLEPLGATNSEAHAIGVQSTGKIVVGGFAVGSSSQFGIARFNTDGSLDTSFGGGGALTSVGTDSGALAMAIQSDDKIVLAGWSTVSGTKVFALARYDASSPTLDSTFGSGGVVIGSADALDEQINGVALQADGKIVAVGSYGSGNSNETTVRRYNADGSLDTSFGTSGTQFLTLMQDGHAVAVLANGSILVAGEYGGAFTVARLTSAGTLDTTFGVNGYAQQGDGSSSGLGKAMQVQQDGKIVVAGTGGNGSASAIAIARFNADGSNDTSFGNSGSTIVQF